MARSSPKVSADRMREWAKSGAEAALKQLRAEIIAIERTFPELALPRARHAVRRSAKTVSRRAYTMSVTARKAVSASMKKYWAERRRAQAKTR